MYLQSGDSLRAARLGSDPQSQLQLSDPRPAFSRLSSAATAPRSSLPTATRSRPGCSMASYHMYRNTTLGNTLQESLDDFITCGQISNALATKILMQFDKSINAALSARIKNRLSFKVSPCLSMSQSMLTRSYPPDDVTGRPLENVSIL